MTFCCQDILHSRLCRLRALEERLLQRSQIQVKDRINMSHYRTVKTCAVWVHVFLYVCVSKALWSHVRPTPTPHEEFQTFLEEEITALWERSPARSWHMVAKWSRQSRAPKHTQKEPWTPCTQCVRHRWERVSNYMGEIKEYPHCTAHKHTHTHRRLTSALYLPRNCWIKSGRRSPIRSCTM